MQEIIDKLNPTNGVEELRVTDEDEYFPPPPPIRDLLTALATAASVTVGGPRIDSIGSDRLVGASQVLAELV